MGEGLADGKPEGEATGHEWRTPPLWGIGLTRTVSGHTRFLHDGRARSMLEAVLWPGGEAAAAKQKVVEMSKEDSSEERRVGQAWDITCRFRWLPYNTKKNQK